MNIAMAVFALLGWLVALWAAFRGLQGWTLEGKDVVTFLVAALGWLVAAFQAWMGYLERRELDRNKHIFDGLQYFTGKTQPRNVGIAVIEGYWATAPELRPLFVPLLANQAVYLLAQSDEETAHEADNLRRIIRRLLSLTAAERVPFAEHLQGVVAAAKQWTGRAAKRVPVTQDEVAKWSSNLL
jgi:hypothetical protein